MKLLRILLEFVGGLTILMVITGCLFVWRLASEGPRPADVDQIKPILNWIGFDPQQKFTIIGSGRSSRSMGGDHIDYYCLQLAKLEFPKDDPREWGMGREQDPFLAQAMVMAIDTAKSEGATCVPQVERVKGGELRIYFLSVRGAGRSATDVDLYLVDPLTKRLYFISIAT
jgi:hypothetical protein